MKGAVILNEAGRDILLPECSICKKVDEGGQY